MTDPVLTARYLYRFLKGSTGQASLPMLRRDIAFTQTDFWFCFLCEAIPEPEVLPIFNTSVGRHRTLSNLMNRTVPHSLPKQLYRDLEEHLDHHGLMYMTLWTLSVLDEVIAPARMHLALTDLEEGIRDMGSDNEFCELYPFFLSLRPAPDAGSDARKLYLQAAFRFTMLGLHAIYGDRMVASAALDRLRTSRLCDPNTLWDMALIEAPRIHSGGYSPRDVATKRNAGKKAEPSGPAKNGKALVRALTAAATAALPPEDVDWVDPAENAGLYVVSNWLDFSISVNDSPRSTYAGAKELGCLYNGTLVYVLHAPGYQGLRVSPNVWGMIVWHGGRAWIPMNLLTRIDYDPKR